jgi:hypothetical protein
MSARLVTTCGLWSDYIITRTTSQLRVVETQYVITASIGRMGEHQLASTGLKYGFHDTYVDKSASRSLIEMNDG